MVVGVEVEGDSRPWGPPGPSSQHRQRQEAAMRDPTSTIDLAKVASKPTQLYLWAHSHCHVLTASEASARSPPHQLLPPFL